MIVQSMTRAGKEMTAHRAKCVDMLVVQVMGDLEPAVVYLDQIERIPLTFSAPALPRGRGSGLDQDDAAVTRPFEEEVQGVADECAVEVPSENEVDTHFDELPQRVFSAEHVPVSQPIRRAHEVMMRHDDPGGSFWGLFERPTGVFDLAHVDLSSGDGAVWSRGVERHDRRALQLHDLVQLRSDVAMVLGHRICDTLPYAVERDVVVAGDRNPGELRELVDEGAGLSELFGACALGQVAADDDGVGAELGCDPLERVTDLREVVWPEMKVGDMKKGDHGAEMPTTIIGSDGSA